jgi:predicted DNA-binding helix-hairpin-helix protein
MHHTFVVGVVLKDRACDVVGEPLPVDFNHAVALAVLIRRDGGGLWTFEHGVVAEAVDDLWREHLREAGVLVLRTELRISDDGASGAITEFHDDQAGVDESRSRSSLTSFRRR